LTKSNTQKGVHQMTKKSIELDPKNREWEYDGDGNKIYKLSAGYDVKTVWQDFEKKGMYHSKMGVIPKESRKDIDEQEEV